MHCKIEINMDGAAFDWPSYGKLELARILREASERAESLEFTLGKDGWPLRDINGNTVGQVIFVED
mgnify:CR=1 FL=1|tara:strand:- start:581 stop:778 length:198 start_codon:yes stop_codon:yes gene_type:complete